MGSGLALNNHSSEGLFCEWPIRKLRALTGSVNGLFTAITTSSREAASAAAAAPIAAPTPATVPPSAAATATEPMMGSASPLGKRSTGKGCS